MENLLTYLFCSQYTKTVTTEEIQSWKSHHRSSKNSKATCEELSQKNQHCHDGDTVLSRHEQHDDDADVENSDDDGSPGSHSPQNPTVICPICIHDIEVGNEAAVLSSCKHVFHKVSEFKLTIAVQDVSWCLQNETSYQK